MTAKEYVMAPSVKKNFLWNASFQLLRIVLPIITVPYLTRVLGPERLGTYSYTYAVANYFSLFAMLGLNQYGNREIARTRNDRKQRSRVFWSIYALQLLSTILVTIAYVVYILFVSPDRLVSLIWLIWVAGEFLDVNWLFFGLEEFRLTVIRNFVIRLASVACIFLFVRSQNDLLTYTALQAVSFLASYVALWPFVLDRVDYYRPSVREVIIHMKPNLLLFAPVVAISFYTQLDKILLGNMTDMTQVGFYDNSERIAQIPLALIQALGTAMLPRMSALVAAGDYHEAIGHLDTSVWFAAVMGWAFCFGVIAVAPEFVPVFFGAGYEECASLMRGLSFMIPIIAWSNVFGVQCLISFGRDKDYTMSVVAGALINLTGNVVFIPRIGTMGAVCSTLLAECAVTLVQARMLREWLPLKKYVRDALPYIAAGVGMLVVVRALAVILPIGIASLILEVLVGSASYVSLGVCWLLVTHDERLWAVLPGRFTKRRP